MEAQRRREGLILFGDPHRPIPWIPPLIARR
jgi:hypothetical protein